MIAIIALGSNLGDRPDTLRFAEKAIQQYIGPVLNVSPSFATEPLLHPDNPTHHQPMFLNSVLLAETHWHPLKILKHLQKIELLAWRDRSNTTPWAPRTLDCDFIAYGDTVFESPELTLPHKAMHERAFVLGPLQCVYPNWQHPLLKKTARALHEPLGHA